MDNNHKAMTEPGDMVERVAYDNVAIEAVQRLIETGKVTLDRDGYLVALPTALAASGDMVERMARAMYERGGPSLPWCNLAPMFQNERIADATAALAASGADRMREALERILRMRPAGDVATATGTRALVQRMEAIARQALGEPQ